MRRQAGRPHEGHPPKHRCNVYFICYAFVMSRVITCRDSDDAYTKFEAAAIEAGRSVSPHASAVLTSSVEPENPEHYGHDLSSQATVPERLTTYERRVLALLSDIRSNQIPKDQDKDGTRENLEEHADVLRNGWVGEYPNVFADVMTELPRRDSSLVLDILDMFRAIHASIEMLPEAERSAVASRRLRFRGFDPNSPYEHALLSYAEHLIAAGKWSELKPYFADDRRGAGWHTPQVPIYRRMLEVFTPLWKTALRELPFPVLNADELRRIAASAYDGLR